MPVEYEPYHCHTMYSNCLTQPDSTVSIENYAKQLQPMNHHVLCLTEHGNRSNVWEQYNLAQKYSQPDYKIVPIAGAECYFVPDRDIVQLKDNRNFHLIVLAKDMEGFYQLNSMLSEANVSGYYYHARVDFDLLGKLEAKRFLVTTACVAGPVRDEESGEKICKTLYDIFGKNFYLEVQHHPQEIQKQHNAKILELQRKYGWPLIYATDSHYIKPEEAALRKELLLSAGIRQEYEDEFVLDLPTNEEAYARMLAQGVLSPAQICEAMENTLQLRDFEGVSFDNERKFPISRPELTLDQRKHLYQKMVCDGYIQKAGNPTPEEAKELRKEMNVILDTDSVDYFIGHHDMIQKGIEKGGILTKTSRGSACGFATNYALGFTSINRLRVPVRMYPERFISREKLMSGNMPDIDLNISNVEAFEEAGKEIFGEYSCYPMIAYGQTKALSAFKLLARARNLDFDTSNEISKQIAIYENDRKRAIENNQDDAEYDVDDDIHIEDYVSEKYLDLIEESKQYRKIVVSWSPHPCAHLIYHKDLRREIGIIRLKAKTGSKKPQYCVYIDGTTADSFGYCKSDLLRVDVVKIIYDTFKMIGRPVMSVDELYQETMNDPDIWALYANGFTQGLNQCERPATTERVMQFKPKNAVELTAFIAAIRPGAKSLVNSFVGREPHTYGIPAMDKLLRLDGATGVTGESSYLFYDEQVLTLAKAAGIDPADAYNLIKAIKKKKLEKVAKYKDRFIPGFISYLQQEQHTNKSLAEKTANDVWTVILNSASYLFNLSHAFAMAMDSLYGAWLKVHAPYEFYTVMLKLYSEKGKQEKIVSIIREMKKYAGIQMTAGRFRQDNRDWYIDKENNRISQSLRAIKFISPKAVQDIYALAEKKYDSFVDLLYDLQMNTCLNTRQIEVLIRVGYFDEFGQTGKLMTIFNEYFEGKNKITKTLKSWKQRMDLLKTQEEKLPDEQLPIEETLEAEFKYVGLCISFDRYVSDDIYFVQALEEKSSVRAQLYSVQRGTTGIVSIKKNYFTMKPLKVGQTIRMDYWASRPVYIFTDNKPKPVPGKFRTWLDEYTILTEPKNI